MKFFIYSLVLGGLVQLTGCKNYDKIMELTERRDSTAFAMEVQVRELAIEKKIIDSLTSQSDALQAQCRLLADSTELVAEDNPMATAYLHRFDTNPILILEEYLTSPDEDARMLLLIKDFLLYQYKGNNESHIAEVRAVFRNLDHRKRELLDQKMSLQDKKQQHDSKVEAREDTLKNLKESQTALNAELKELK